PGPALYVLRYDPGRRSRADAGLLNQVDPQTGKASKELRVASTARGLAHSAAERALFVSSKDEIRTFFLPELTSGPVFRVPGSNGAIALTTDRRLLVAQSDALLLVDLADRPGEKGVAPRASVPTPVPVAVIAVASDGRSALAGLADGHVVGV